MRHTCQLGCGRSFLEMEFAEMHEAVCDGAAPRRRVKALRSANARTDDRADELRDLERLDDLAQEERRNEERGL